ncbi:MAG: hypothetical protein K0R92_3325 [Lachnospiraceae bacterium]|jgi:hypothetical protein|nr:hypothetical protein [Lachnospiraceae bacterium]
MKIEQYRWLDLLLLSIMAVGTEILGNWLFTQFPSAGFYISFSMLIVIIALFRWGSYGAIVSCLIAIPATLLSETVSIQLFLFYFISNSTVFMIPKIFRHIDNTLIVSKSYWFLGYIVSFYGVLTASRGLLGFLLGLSFSATVMQTISQLLFSMIMSYLVLLLIKNREGLLTDMTVYFINEQKEIKE